MRIVYLSIAFFVLVLDQITKWAILARFSPDTVMPVIPGFFSVVRVENRGIAFGLLSELSSGVAFAFIISVSGAALGLVCYLLWKSESSAKLASIALALVMGGAVGNLLDRLIRGSVVDFLDFYIHGYHWPAFNIADSAIVIGAGMLLVDLFVGQPSKVDARCV